MARSKAKRARGGASPSARSRFAAEFELATRHHRAGELERASAIYADILRQAPDEPDATHLLGVVAIQQGDPTRARALIEHALERAPKNPDYHHNLGRALADAGHTEQAEASFRSAVKLRPDFALAHNHLGMSLQQRGRTDDAIAAYRKATRIAPDFAEAHNNLGVALQARGEIPEAIESFSRAVELDARYVEAYGNLGAALVMHESALGEISTRAAAHLERGLAIAPGDAKLRHNLAMIHRRVISRWHFPMLNDAPRNRAYDEALRRAVSADSVVLDVGAGSGLLAMMAARAGARHVYACEMVDALARKAREIVARNGLENRVTVIGKRSDRLEVGVDLPERPNLLVTETFDPGLIGEGVLTTIAHAREHLLAPGARIVPRGARLRAALVESEELAALDRVDRAGGFDVSPFNEFAMAPTSIAARLDNFEHRHLSDAFDVFEIEFATASPAGARAVLEVPCIEDGACHAIVLWFRLELDEHAAIDTAPGGAGTHWTHAVHLTEAPRPVRRGDVVRIAAEYDALAVRLSFDSA